MLLLPNHPGALIQVDLARQEQYAGTLVGIRRRAPRRLQHTTHFHGGDTEVMLDTLAAMDDCIEDVFHNIDICKAQLSEWEEHCQTMVTTIRAVQPPDYKVCSLRVLGYIDSSRADTAFIAQCEVLGLDVVRLIDTAEIVDMPQASLTESFDWLYEAAQSDFIA